MAAHVADEGDGAVVTDWVLVAAMTTIAHIGTGLTSYMLEGNTGQPVHVMAGLFHYARERVLFYPDGDE